MVDNATVEVIDQLVLHKLEFTRQLLRESSLPCTGDRSIIRGRLLQAVEDERLPVSLLQELLNELDIWGQQRVRWVTMPISDLTNYQTPEAIQNKAEQTGLGNLFLGEMMLIPPTDMTPVVISYEERNENRYLKLVSAKSQTVREEQRELEPIVNEDHPGVVYYPFVEKTQKVVAFAEINLSNGETLISCTMIRQGIQFATDFAGFFQCFSSFFPFEQGNRNDLYQANHAIHQLSSSEVQLAKRRTRTSSGGVVICHAHSPRADIRADHELGLTHQALPDAPGVFTDCHWELCSGLTERVHTHVYGPDGEVSILGKVKEESARYVLRRIYEINY